MTDERRTELEALTKEQAFEQIEKLLDPMLEICEVHHIPIAGTIIQAIDDGEMIKGHVRTFVYEQSAIPEIMEKETALFMTTRMFHGWDAAAKGLLGE